MTVTIYQSMDSSITGKTYSLLADDTEQQIKNTAINRREGHTIHKIPGFRWSIFGNSCLYI